MKFFKYHALGNDYIVLDPADFPGWTVPTPAQIKAVCHRNFGVGSDGILWGPIAPAEAPRSVAKAGPTSFSLRIFNPDGSEAEKSGNGTRIFARYLWDRKYVKDDSLAIATPGGNVSASTRDGGRLIRMDMGRVSFMSDEIPVAGPRREVINEKFRIQDRDFTYCAATIGNPHCVLLLDGISPDMARRYGPDIETHSLFPRKTNVQFLKVLDRGNISIEIWERGAGYTLASGTSASAASAVARRLGLVDGNLTVHMPGGALAVEIGDGMSITMTGPVRGIASGELDPEIFLSPGT